MKETLFTHKHILSIILGSYFKHFGNILSWPKFNWCLLKKSIFKLSIFKAEADELFECVWPFCEVGV